jgi:uncharacterized protein (TIGR03435 family)
LKVRNLIVLVRPLLVTTVVFTGNAAVLCQTPQGQKSMAPDMAPLPSFDVVAIHLHRPAPSERSHIVDSNGRFTTVNVGLKAIIQWAFDVPASRVVGGQAWMNSERYDIEAKSEYSLDTSPNYDAVTARQEKRSMVQSLLADRFHLVSYFESRVLPIDALVVQRADLHFSMRSPKAPPSTKAATDCRLKVERTQ